MAGRRIGVDIGSSAVRAAELALGGGPPSLVRIAQVPLPPGAVENGEVRDPDVVAESLRELWGKGRFKARDVVLGVGNQRVVVREVTLPWLAPKEMRESLPYQVQEFVPIPVEDAVLDYQIVEELQQDGKHMARMLLVAAQKVMIQQIVRAAEAAKLKPVGLDLIPFAIMRSVGSLDGGALDEDVGDEVVIDIGADITSICVHSGGLPRFVRILPSGGRDITQAVARTLSLSDEEAERLKRGRGDEADAAMTEEVMRVAAGRGSSFVDEIRSSLDFYQSQMPGASVGRVLVTGGGSKLRGLLPLLDERLAPGVYPGHPLAKVVSKVDLDERSMVEIEPLLAVAIGLAMPGARG